MADNLELRLKLETAINECSAENGSNTADFILAEYLIDCLAAYDKAVSRRDAFWNGQKPEDVLECKGSPNFDV